MLQVRRDAVGWLAPSWLPVLRCRTGGSAAAVFSSPSGRCCSRSQFCGGSTPPIGTHRGPPSRTGSGELELVHPPAQPARADAQLRRPREHQAAPNPNRLKALSKLLRPGSSRNRRGSRRGHTRANGPACRQPAPPAAESKKGGMDPAGPLTADHHANRCGERQLPSRASAALGRNGSGQVVACCLRVACRHPGSPSASQGLFPTRPGRSPRPPQLGCAATRGSQSAGSRLEPRQQPGTSPGPGPWASNGAKGFQRMRPHLQKRTSANDLGGNLFGLLQAHLMRIAAPRGGNRCVSRFGDVAGRCFGGGASQGGEMAPHPC